MCPKRTPTPGGQLHVRLDWIRFFDQQIATSEITALMMFEAVNGTIWYRTICSSDWGLVPQSLATILSSQGDAAKAWLAFSKPQRWAHSEVPGGLGDATAVFIGGQ